MTGPRKKRLFNGLMPSGEFINFIYNWGNALTGVKKCLASGTPLYICTFPLNDRVRRWSCLPECRWKMSEYVADLGCGPGNGAPPFYNNVGLRPG